MMGDTQVLKPMIEAIHSTPTQAVIYVAGAASYAIGWLTSVPGASNTLLEAAVLYSRMSLIQLLGKIPAQFASVQTSEDMALVAYNRALKISKPGRPVLGVGITGALATNRSKQGDHRFHLSTRMSNRVWNSTVTLAKGLRTREEEEIFSSQYVLKAIANASNVPVVFPASLNDLDVCTETERLLSEDEELEQLLNGQICFKVYPFSGEEASSYDRKVILPGSFNPLHEGHLQLMEVAISGHEMFDVVRGEKVTWIMLIRHGNSVLGDGYPCFELSAFNADKPPLIISKIKERVQQFEKVGKTVVVSTQPFYYKKAELFPGSAFVIGTDTVVRLLNPKYYDGSYNKMVEVLLKCKSTGCVFVVGGRNVDGVFMVLEDIDIPEVLKVMFIPIPADKFRMDISSTEIRKKLGM